MTEYRLPPEARTWLNAVERALTNVRPPQRVEIVDGLRAHIIEALERGDAVDDVLYRLGSPTEIANLAAQEELETIPTSMAPTRYVTVQRVVQFAACALAIVAASVIALLPGSVENTVDSHGNITSTTTTIALFNMDQKVAATLVVAILLTAVPLLVRGRGWRPVTISVAILMVVLAALTTLWIVGWFIVPAAVLSVIAACLPTTARRRSASRPKSVAV